MASAIGPLLGAIAVATWTTAHYLSAHPVGVDSHAYWLAGRTDHPYRMAPGQIDAFLYSPLFAQAMRLLAWLPWHAFFVVFAAVSCAAFWWLAQPLPWRSRGPVLLVCLTEVMTGNISGLLAVALVFSVTHSAAIAGPTLTKIAPGGVALLWHLFRKDWASCWRATVATTLLASFSFVLEPHLWFEWIKFLSNSASDGPRDIVPRLAVALVLVIYASRADRPGLLAVAFWLSMPMATLSEVPPMTVLVAAVRLAEQHDGRVAGPRREKMVVQSTAGRWLGSTLLGPSWLSGTEDKAR